LLRINDFIGSLKDSWALFFLFATKPMGQYTCFRPVLHSFFFFEFLHQILQHCIELVFATIEMLERQDVQGVRTSFQQFILHKKKRTIVTVSVSP